MAKGSTGSDVLVKIGGDVSEFQNSLAGVLGDVQQWVMGLNPVLAGVVGGVALIGGAAVTVATQFEEAFHTIQGVTGATGTALEGLKGDFAAVFKTGDEDAATVAHAHS